MPTLLTSTARAIAGDIPTHDQVLTLSWEPADTGEDRAKFWSEPGIPWTPTRTRWRSGQRPKASASQASERRRRDSGPVSGGGILLAKFIVLGMALEDIGPWA